MSTNTPDGLLLYSTNTYLKWLICERYRKEHFVWCSAAFDGNAAGFRAVNITTAHTSNPKDLYTKYRKSVKNADRHDPTIPGFAASLKGIATSNWLAPGKITQAEHQEIIFEIDNAAITDWRPLLFVIPLQGVQQRCKLVPAQKRAGRGYEWIIEDLRAEEFDVLELPDA